MPSSTYILVLTRIVACLPPRTYLSRRVKTEYILNSQGVFLISVKKAIQALRGQQPECMSCDFPAHDNGSSK